MATDPAPTETAPSRSVLGLLVLLAVLPYLNTLSAGFTLDDWPNVRANPAVTKGFDLTGIFATPMPLDAYLYRPVTVVTFALNEAAAPGNAAAFHLVNVLLHAGITLLVYYLGLQLFAARVGLIAAVLFALHPLHTEAVTSIVGRAELLAALCGLLALRSTDAADAAPGRGWKRWWYGCSILCFGIALFSKESAATILPLLLLYRVTRRGDPLFTGMRHEVCSLYWVPYAVCLGIFLYFRFLVVGTLGGIAADHLPPLDNIFGVVPWTVRLRSAFGVLWDYFGLLNLPVVLSADYSYNQVPVLNTWLDPRCLAGIVLCVAGAAASVMGGPAVRFSVAFPFVALLLTSNLLFPIGTVKAERLLYLPSVGWALLVAFLCDRLLRGPRHRAMGTAIIMLLVVVFSARTWARNEDWKDNLSLFASTARTAPNSAKAQYNFGSALQAHGVAAAALAQYQRALAIASWTEGADLGIGIGYEKAGQVDEAIAWYHKALLTARGYHEAHTNLCHILVSNQRFADATAACRGGLRYRPGDANLLKGLGASLVALGETDKGVDILGRSLALDPDDDELRSYIASLHTAVARRDEERSVLR